MESEKMNNVAKKKLSSKKGITLGFMIAAILLFFVSNASAGCIGVDTGYDYKCGDTVIESCVFEENLVCSDTHGLEVGADGITIDGNGYCVDGVNPVIDKYGIYNYLHDNVTIKNLEIKNFYYGIRLEGSAGGDDNVEYNTIYNCSVHDNGDEALLKTNGIELRPYVCHCNITNNRVYNTTGGGRGCEAGGQGIRLHTSSCYNSIVYNDIYGNVNSGIFSKMKCKHNYVAYNDIHENGHIESVSDYWGGGMRLECLLTNKWLVEYNNVTDNLGPGIFVRGSYNVIRYNNVTYNQNANNNGHGAGAGVGYGIYLNEDSKGNNVSGNMFCFNNDTTYGATAYDVGDGGTNNHGDCNTCDTRCEGTTIRCCKRCTGGVTVEFSAEPLKGVEPLAVNFTDNSDPQENITAWLWDFGDEETSTAQNPNHTYYTDEPYSYYDVTLTVNDTEGGIYDSTKRDYIVVWKSESEPNADFATTGSRKMGIYPFTVNFTDNSLGEVTSWAWDFDSDGVVDNTDPNPTHTYNEAGIYNVSLNVTGPEGSAKETKTRYIVVAQDPHPAAQLDAQFFASSRSGHAPMQVTFTDLSEKSSEGDIREWKWYFGDGTTSSERNPTHIYTAEGNYTVSLEITGADNETAKETKYDYIMVTSGAPTPFVIKGWVVDTEGNPVNGANVRVTNLDTDASWTAMTSTASNYYRLVLGTDDLSAGNTLQFLVGSQTVQEHDVTQTGIKAGGIFDFNLTGAPIIHDIAVSTDFYPPTGIRIENAATGAEAGQNLIIDEKYYISYKLVNVGIENETVNITVCVSNETGWNETINTTRNLTVNVREPKYGEDEWNTTGLAPGRYTITVNANIPVDDNPGNNQRTREINLVFTAPDITLWHPAKTVVADIEKATRTFDIATDQAVNVSWFINGTEVFTETCVTESSYANTSAVVGTWNVSAFVINEYGMDMRTWTWYVTPVPPKELKINSFVAAIYNYTLNSAVNLTYSGGAEATFVVVVSGVNKNTGVPIYANTTVTFGSSATKDVSVTESVPAAEEYVGEYELFAAVYPYDKFPYGMLDLLGPGKAHTGVWGIINYNINTGNETETLVKQPLIIMVIVDRTPVSGVYVDFILNRGTPAHAVTNESGMILYMPLATGELEILVYDSNAVLKTKRTLKVINPSGVFDTGADSLPSISGTHEGVIIPDRNITVNRMYTYPSQGTGGHTEYVRIWNESEEIEGAGNWSGYQGDYHNITISPAITLLKGHEYNYIIRTGSYPQIVHASEHIAKIGGNITCTKFTDANGKVHEEWIPAIRLWKEE